MIRSILEAELRIRTNTKTLDLIKLKYENMKWAVWSDFRGSHGTGFFKDHEEYCELFDDIMSDIMAEREDPVAGIQLTLPLLIGDFRI